MPTYVHNVVLSDILGTTTGLSVPCKYAAGICAKESAIPAGRPVMLTVLSTSAAMAVRESTPPDMRIAIMLATRGAENEVPLVGP